jgi:pimeloyl-ACP methyl ester carboxylesterase
MGAAIALRFTLEHPDRVLGLVLSRPAWLDQSRVDNMKVFSTLAEYIRKYGAWEGAQRYQETEAFQHVKRVSPDNANSLLSQFTHPRDEETVSKLERIPNYVPKHRREDWRRITVPTLVIVNRQDEIHPFVFGESLARDIPNARVVEVAPKSVSKDRHVAEVQQALATFFADNAARWDAPRKSNPGP